MDNGESFLPPVCVRVHVELISEKYDILVKAMSSTPWVLSIVKLVT